MGKRGPKPTPTLKLAQRGSWRADLRDGEVEPVPGDVSAPSWLSDRAREEWAYHAPLLFPSGLLTPQDRNALAMYCQTMAQYVTALETVAAEGLLHTTKNGNTIQNPAVGVMNTAMEMVRKLGALFGLSPADRVGLKAQPVKEKDAKGKERFFG